jgi:hypothetical protein
LLTLIVNVNATPPELSRFRIVAPHKLRQSPIKGYATLGLNG